MLQEYPRLADKRDMVTFSNFLNLNEINLFFQTVSELTTQYKLSGGYEFAERQMVSFIPDALSLTPGYQVKFPNNSPYYLKISMYS